MDEAGSGSPPCRRPNRLQSVCRRSGNKDKLTGGGKVFRFTGVTGRHAAPENTRSGVQVFAVAIIPGLLRHGGMDNGAFAPYCAAIF